MKLEVLQKNCCYPIYNKGINGCLIFENGRHKNYFLQQLSKYLVGKISIYGYCLIDNNFHLVMLLNQEEKIATQAFSSFFLIPM
jgi:putative transposase